MLFDAEAPPRRLQAAVTSRIKIMAEMNIAERRLPQDGRIRVTPRGRRVDIRVSTIPTVHGESIVMRCSTAPSVFLPLEKLGFEPASPALRAHHPAAARHPPGHRAHRLRQDDDALRGARQDQLARTRKIITVEDPVEYQLKGVNQIQVKPKIGLTFAGGPRHIVRQDPDVILVGEIRDLETAEIAIQASLTGHLVFSTLHTNDAPGAITRLLDMGVEPYLVASVLEGCSPSGSSGGSARRAASRTSPTRRALRRWASTGPRERAALARRRLRRVPRHRLSRPHGHLRAVPDHRGRSEPHPPRRAGHEIRQRAIAGGMVTLRLDGWAKGCRGVTTVEEILRVTQEDTEA